MAKKILIVDDEPLILTTIKDRLTYEGYQILTAVDGKTALAVAEEERPDIVILDIVLPDIDGYQICRAIKANKELASVVIMVTSKIDAVDAVKARDAGADDFVAKTSDHAGILKAIKQYTA